MDSLVIRSIIIVTDVLLEEKIRNTLQGVEHVKAIDLSDGCGSKFEIEIIATEFEGKPLIAQHRLVHKAIENERKTIHALTLKTSVPKKL